MTNETRLGQELSEEKSMEISYGLLLEQDEYELVYMVMGLNLDDQSRYFFLAMDLVEQLAKENSTGGIVISREDYNDDIYRFEVWKNLTRTRRPEELQAS